MFDLDFANIVQAGLPVSIVFQVFGEMPGKKNVSRVPARHNPLGHVDSRAGQIGAIIYIGDRIDRSAVNTHSQFKSGMILHCLAHFQRAFQGRFWVVAKDEHHPITGR